MQKVNGNATEHSIGDLRAVYCGFRHEVLQISQCDDDTSFNNLVCPHSKSRQHLREELSRRVSKGQLSDQEASTLSCEIESLDQALSELDDNMLRRYEEVKLAGPRYIECDREWAGLAKADPVMEECREAQKAIGQRLKEIVAKLVGAK